MPENGVGNPSIYAEIHAERVRAHAKHGPNSMESYPVGSFIRYTILAEEVGEIAKEFNEAEARGGQHSLDFGRLRAEAVQVAAMASAWADVLTQCDEGCHDRGNDCPKCGSGDWSLMCESCRSYAAQDAERP